MRIGIIGASSQVGSSIALYLKHFSGTDVVGFVRSAYSSVFFELFNISYDKIDLNDGAQLRKKLENFDVVIDCTYPAGQLYSILPAIRRNLNLIISAMPRETVFIYMSSIMAYGMPFEKSHIEHYSIPRSSYAYIKRKAENETVRLCKKYAVKGYNFRLSQVHGFLQSVNTSFRNKLSNASVAYISGSGQDLTNTIFINSVCEAIIKCVKGEVKPGLYTLVSQPQWTLEELYSYYTFNYNIDCKLEYFKNPKLLSQRRSLMIMGIGFLKKYRPLLETYILMRSPKASIAFKGRYRQSETYRAGNEFTPKEAIDRNLLGTPSLNIITGIRSSANEVVLHEKEIETFYNKIISENRK
jgi:nucleoside-diphosphate-sugar epimerase